MGIEELTAVQLRQFIQSTREDAYRLVDVRQPGEYELSHIPGALLLPLPELVQSASALPQDRAIVFYCRSGGRSMAAATIVEDEQMAGGALYNLTGGILAWDGGLTEAYPRIELFDFQAPPAQMLLQAMNLEKGALNFYQHVQRQFSDAPWADVFDRLSKAEIGHARTVYHHYAKLVSAAPDFETVFEGLDGMVLEGGTSLEDAVDQVSAISGGIEVSRRK